MPSDTDVRAALDVCPFCGEPAYMLNGINRRTDGDGWCRQVHCLGCGAIGAEGHDDEQASGLWNARAALQPSTAVSEDRARDLLVDRIAEVMQEDGGCWSACSGCQESNDGCVSTRDYPYSSLFKCQPGAGCRECGGIGVLWQDGEFLSGYADAAMLAFARETTPPVDAGETTASERSTLIAAGFDEYAVSCALRTDPDGGFCSAYFYSDGQWRYQTGGLDLTGRSGETIRCVLTKRLYAFASTPTASEETVRLREAAQPFVAFINGGAADMLPDDFVITHGSSMARRQITIGDCRALRQALTMEGEGD